MKEQSEKEKFINSIQPNKTCIKDKLPFIWVFGSSMANEQSHRRQYINWLNSQQHDFANYIRTPEHYPEWNHFGVYRNLVDFEIDIVSISLGTIIFSESIGTYMEIAIFSCFPELHKNLLVVAPRKYVQRNCNSFFQLGPIAKIQENEIEEKANIWALDLNSNASQNLINAFEDISTHFLDIVTSPQQYATLEIDNKSHTTLLLLDLIDLFPYKNRKFYIELLNNFDIRIQNQDVKKIFELLEMLELIQEHKSGNNTLYKIHSRHCYKSLIFYTPSGRSFNRANFKIENNR